MSGAIYATEGEGVAVGEVEACGEEAGVGRIADGVVVEVAGECDGADEGDITRGRSVWRGDEREAVFMTEGAVKGSAQGWPPRGVVVW